MYREKPLINIRFRLLYTNTIIALTWKVNWRWRTWTWGYWEPEKNLWLITYLFQEWNSLKKWIISINSMNIYHSTSIFNKPIVLNAPGNIYLHKWLARKCQPSNWTYGKPQFTLKYSCFKNNYSCCSILCTEFFSLRWNLNFKWLTYMYLFQIYR